MKFLNILLVLLCLMCGFLSYRLYSQRKSFEMASQQIDNKTQFATKALRDALVYSGQLHCDTSLLLSDAMNRKLSLGNILSHRRHVVILRISQSFCIKCLETELPKLNTFAKKDSVVVITNVSNFTEISSFIQLKHASLSVYYIDDRKNIFYNVDEHREFFFPFLFSTDSSAVGKSFYIMNASAPELSDLYYNSL